MKAREDQAESFSRFGIFVRRFQIPNVLTTIRILLIPVFLIFLFSGDRWLALAAFVVLMITDQTDGFLARRYRVITDFGKIADPIADKALMLSALISLNLLGDLWWSVTIIIFLREMGITLWRMVLLSRGRVVPASRGGKLKTVLQTVAVALFIAPLPSWGSWVSTPIMALALCVTVVTGIQYIVDASVADKANS